MRKEPATRLLHLARLFAAELGGIGLEDIVAKLQVSRRTAERMRDATAVSLLASRRLGLLWGRRNKGLSVLPTPTHKASQAAYEGSIPFARSIA
jgi:hypothetical protein